MATMTTVISVPVPSTLRARCVQQLTALNVPQSDTVEKSILNWAIDQAKHYGFEADLDVPRFRMVYRSGFVKVKTFWTSARTDKAAIAPKDIVATPHADLIPSIWHTAKQQADAEQWKRLQANGNKAIEKLKAQMAGATPAEAEKTATAKSVVDSKRSDGTGYAMPQVQVIGH